MKKLFTLMFCGLMLCAAPAEAKLKFVKKKKKPQPTAPAPKPAPKPQVDRKGLFNVTKMKGDWFFELPDSLLGRDFLTTTRYTTTPAGSGKFGGEQVNEQTVYFEMLPDSVLALRARLLVNVADSTERINKAITISNENPIIGTFKIESNKNHLFKFKVTQFFNEDNTALGIPTRDKQSFGLSGQMMSLIEDIKSFPTNTEIRVLKTFMSPSGSLTASRATGRVTLGLNISFILLPEVPMLPRYYDPRVGYFTVGYNTYNDQQQRVKNKVLISRWRLEPKPEDVEKMKRGELVEPIKPIVYYIDPATPKQWRKYLIQGVNDWQSAFEKAGFKNAIRAEEWPENDSTMSMEDARYSVIRYLASPIANAYGPHVSDPRTGEIMESHICWYHNVMSLVHDWYMVQASSIDDAARRMHYDEELMGQLIRFVSSHEVGHTLGLRHNFGSSSTVPVDSLRSKAFVEKFGHTPSIMDYARFNYVAQPEDCISQNGIFPRINDYDNWAIEWGYRPMLDATNSDEDHAALEKLIGDRLQKNPRLWWGDGETSQDDPRRQTEDLGDDAVKASEYGIKNLKREIVNLPAWTMSEEDIYNENLGEMHTQIRSQFLRYTNHVIRNIGGQLEQYRTNTEDGDVYTPQPRKKQTDAMDYLKRNIVTEPTWLAQDLKYAKRLWADPQTITIAVGRTAISNAVARITSLNDNYKPSEFLADMTKMLFAASRFDKYTAALQSTYVEVLISYYKSFGTNNPTRGHVMEMLKTLKTRTAAAVGDADLRAHYSQLNDAITRALNVNVAQGGTATVVSGR